MDDIENYSPRIQYLYHRYIPELIQFWVGRGNVKNLKIIEETTRKILFPNLLACDPTTNKSATQWIIVTFLNGCFLYEDLGKVHETLTEFIRYKSQLPVEKRSFNHYRTLADMWNAIAPMVEKRLNDIEDSPSGKEIKKFAKEKAYRETIFIHQDVESGFMVVSPMTQYASQWWGKGTRWCTSGGTHNAFFDYHKYSPLIIIVMPDKQKLQLFVSFFGVYFMDSRDVPVSLQYTEDNWDYLSSVMISFLKEHPKVFQLIPQKYLTFDMCLNGFKEDYNTLKFFPVEYFKPDFCLKCVKENIHVVEHFPKEIFNKEFCISAVKQNSKAIMHIPKSMITEEVIKHLESPHEFIGRIPHHLQTKQMVIKNIKWDCFYLRLCNPILLDISLIERACRKGLNFKDVPKEFLTKELFWKIHTKGKHIKYIPEIFLDDEKFIMQALTNNMGVLRFVTLEKRTLEICRIALSVDPLSLHDVPNSLKDYEMCLKAVTQNGLALHSLPKEYLTRKLLLTAVASRAEALEAIEVSMIDKEICMVAFKTKPDLYFTPAEFITFDMALKAICRDGRQFKFVGHHFLQIKEYLKKRKYVFVFNWFNHLFHDLYEVIFFKTYSDTEMLKKGLRDYEEMCLRNQTNKNIDHTQKLSNLKDNLKFLIDEEKQH